MEKPSIAALFSITLAGCMGYVPGQQSYWDAQVREMCAKDGGVKILDQVRILKSDIENLEHINGKISVQTKELARANSPVYSVTKATVLNDSNPKVWRDETEIIRRFDQMVVARLVTYSRVGGDFPSLAHPSNFTCPDSRRIVSEREKLFIVEGDLK